jgi:hypothetical protein
MLFFKNTLLKYMKKQKNYNIPEQTLNCVNNNNNNKKDGQTMILVYPFSYPWLIYYSHN